MGILLLAEYDSLLRKRRAKRHTQASRRRLDGRLDDLTFILTDLGLL